MLAYAAPYQALMAYAFREAKGARSFAKLHKLFSRIGVPQGYYVELAAEVSYIGSYLIEDEMSDCWYMFYVAQLMNIVAGVLQDVYDSYRLGALSVQ